LVFLDTCNTIKIIFFVIVAFLDTYILLIVKKHMSLAHAHGLKSNNKHICFVVNFLFYIFTKTRVCGAQGYKLNFACFLTLPQWQMRLVSWIYWQTQSFRLLPTLWYSLRGLTSILQIKNRLAIIPTSRAASCSYFEFLKHRREKNEWIPYSLASHFLLARATYSRLVPRIVKQNKCT
jgi:hypothetical protein